VLARVHAHARMAEKWSWFTCT